MKRFGDGIPKKVLKEVFPNKLNNRGLVAEELYTELTKLILSGKLKKRQGLTPGSIAQHFNISIPRVYEVISKLKKDKLIISKGRKGYFVTDPLRKGR